MPDRKTVPCSSSYLSRSVTSGRCSLTGAELARPGAVVVGAPLTACFPVLPMFPVVRGTPALPSLRWAGRFPEMGQVTLPPAAAVLNGRSERYGATRPVWCENWPEAENRVGV